MAREIKRRAFIGVYNGYMRAGRGSSCLLWEHGAGVQLLTVGTLGHVQGVQLLSEYIGAESTVSTQGQGSSCIQWVHGGNGV